MLPILIKKGRIDFTYSRFHFWIALSMGLGYAILFFFFVVGMREMVRLSFYAFEQESKILLSNMEILFYNFFLAFVSCLIGGSKCLEFLVRANNKVKPHIRTSINTNQSGFLWFSIFWLSKIGAYLSFFLPIVNQGAYFNLIDYWYVFIAILIVLFYAQWNGFIHHFKNGMKIRNRVGVFYILISALLSIFSFFLLSGINRVIQNNSVSFNYDIETPKSEIGRRFDFKNYTPINLYLGSRNNPKKDSLCIVGSGPTIELTEMNLAR
jgi:hypothetical protein